LFRLPYNTDPEPTEKAALDSLAEASRLGYVVAGAEVDSQDYARPGTDRIVENVLTGLRNTGGNVIVFHDAGGDRRQTVAAVDRLIPLLRREGYRIVGVDQLASLPRSVLMPPVGRTEQAIALGTGAVVWLRGTGFAVLVALFAVTTLFSIARILTLGVLVMRRQNGMRAAPAAEFMPDIRVLIPAFNEAKVIERTLAALLRSDYPKMRVSVIDDGSTDETAALAERIAVRDPRVTLISQARTGKAAALNRGFEGAAEEFVVTIDADTIVLPHTVRKLVEPFADPSIDAVCGNVQVGNVTNVLTAFQSVEYVTSQNYDRRAFDHLNCISVVPGATGAWRRRAVLAAGGYSSQTLTEDTDLTLSVLARGGRITYAPFAQSVTEVPETAAALFRQRFRWSFGALQCLWKHRRELGTGTLGWIALPNMFLFQVLFPLLAPFGDLILLFCLLRRDIPPVAVGYMMFLAMDLVGSGVAFRLDRRRLRGIWVVFVQRFFYRQFMYVVTFAAVIGALRGRRHGWRKLERTGAIPLAGWAEDAAPVPGRASLRPAATLQPVAE
jgi:cellulose synthase/poly-beta-1,6-N-acetylglucosamine synthase-like glycosyltransferase